MTLAVLEEELEAAQGWAARNRWTLAFNEKDLVLAAMRAHPVDNGQLLLEASCDQYRALPPAWRFVDPETREPTAASTPRGDSFKGRASVIHSVGVICAHFSRTAYKQHHEAGPHDAWGELTSWEEVKEGVQAHTIAEMLAVINQHLQWSKGRRG
ncbi:MAG: hypothetical protein ACT4OM_00690 [Actinomycetota bacterium]